MTDLQRGRSKRPARDRSEENLNRSKKTKTNCSLCVFLVVAGGGDLHRRRGKEEEKKPLQAPLFFQVFQRRRMNPRATSDGGAWEDASFLFLRVQKSFPAISRILGTVL